MTLTEPTLAPSTVDMAQIFAAHAERAARIDALCGFRKFPDSDYGNSRTLISVNPGQ